MLFIDDEARDSFHKASTLLQVVCQIFESELSKNYLLCELIEAASTDEGHKAMFVICPADDADKAVEAAVVDDVLLMLNRRFRRSDNTLTVTVESEDYNIVYVRVTTAADFSQLT